MCQKRLCTDWQKHFGHRLLLLETFVDPQRFVGTVYAAANWIYLGLTRGYRRTRQGYSNAALSLFKKSSSNRSNIMPAPCSAAPVLPCPYRQGVVKMKLNAQQMLSLPDFFADIPDPRRAQGRRHSLACVLAIVCGATLCGMRGYKAMADWAQSLASKARQRFRCRLVSMPTTSSLANSLIRDVMIRVHPADLDQALQTPHNQAFAQQDSTLAIDGKTMCNALDQNDHQTHVMSVVGHHTKTCYTQKKSALCPPSPTPPREPNKRTRSV